MEADRLFTVCAVVGILGWVAGLILPVLVGTVGFISWAIPAGIGAAWCWLYLRDRLEAEGGRE